MGGKIGKCTSEKYTVQTIRKADPQNVLGQKDQGKIRQGKTSQGEKNPAFYQGASSSIGQGEDLKRKIEVEE